jgi:hypothetical protein
MRLLKLTRLRGTTRMNRAGGCEPSERPPPTCGLSLMRSPIARSCSPSLKLQQKLLYDLCALRDTLLYKRFSARTSLTNLSELATDSR